MKKLFHRKKNNEPGSSPASSPYSRGDPGLQTSLYDTTSTSGLPQSGDYPLRGNDTPNVLRKKPSSRRSSIRSWRSSSSQQLAPYQRSPTPDRYGSPELTSPSSNRGMMGGSEAYAPQPAGSRRWSRSQLPQDFSNMSLGSNAPITTTTTTTTTGPYTTVHPLTDGASGSNAALQRPMQSQAQRREGPAPTAPSIRPVNPSDGQDVRVTPSAKSKYSAREDGIQNQNSSFDGGRRVSIPRKQVGAGSSSSAGKRHSRDGSAGASYAPDSSLGNGIGAGSAGKNLSNGARSSLENGRALDAQAIVAKAHTSTKDTSVTEKYAPAVVHETVHKDVHHIREELIRKEIHTHDVYHRILPVVDVEVLPARHFLPVEGGGLVEISADEVPGRKNNWVLAETVSQIPSGQPAPRSARDFTAREFPGTEGDDVKSTAPDGHERTEQTWVHPPELETGARDTGQSWPMVFGKDEPKEGTYGYRSPKSKKRSSRHAKTSSRSSGTAGERVY